MAIQVPPESLSTETLERIIKEHLGREIGDADASAADAQKALQRVKERLSKGELILTFDEETESCGLLTAQEFNKKRPKAETLE